MVASSPRPPAPRSGSRRRASHSLETVLEAAIALLDESGEKALTFRALAARLGGGVASIYWYVSSRDELLDRAADLIMGRVVAKTEAAATGPDPIDNLRSMSLTLFDAMVERPWIGAYFLRNAELQPNSILMWERLGQQTLRLDLTAQQRFHAAAALTSHVIGVAADMGMDPPQELIDGEVGREEFLGRFVETWRSLDPEKFPFVHQIADEFATHDDADQFRAGLDLLLAGLRLQAEAGQPAS